MLLKQFVILLYSSLLLACAGHDEVIEGDDSAAETRRSDCISSGTIRDYQVLDDANLIVSGSGKRKYHITLSRRATGLREEYVPVRGIPAARQRR